MPNEAKICLACNQQYTLVAVDFDFYKKLHVAPPRVCPDCQLQRLYDPMNTAQEAQNIARVTGTLSGEDS